MTYCKCNKPRFSLHLESKPQNKKNPMKIRCKICGGLEKCVNSNKLYTKENGEN